MTAGKGIPVGAGLGELEGLYLDAREAWDRVDVARATGGGGDLGLLETAARSVSRDVADALDAVAATEDDLPAEERRAVATMRATMATVDGFLLPVPRSPTAGVTASTSGPRSSSRAAPRCEGASGPASPRRPRRSIRRRAR